ncbi:hypothetical protein RHGRI_034065 [Rhododendron griersonianum]|uniref:Uncharacterized protein n=1 Tax=Rhododendron griersonianum TaxID=479676 RepID=A0AAV6HZL4_9ERIC|nr:hypothetical protein RHGRI_034065 [Rhododendron griersonianum]
MGLQSSAETEAEAADFFDDIVGILNAISMASHPKARAPATTAVDFSALPFADCATDDCSLSLCGYPSRLLDPGRLVGLMWLGTHGRVDVATLLGYWTLVGW